MTVVSDTSPVNYLVLIGCSGVLPALFGDVLLPDVVDAELRGPGAPEEVRLFLASNPPWIKVAAPTIPPRLAAANLDRGERAAIALALQSPAPLLLIDESRGRAVAAEFGVAVLGTIGILRHAESKGLVDAGVAAERLRKTNFRVSPKLMQLLESDLPGRG